MSDDGFYVGYEPQAPVSLAVAVRRRVLAIVGIAALAAVALAASLPATGSGRFEYGVRRSYEGTLVARPHPVLLVDSAGRAASTLLLVAPGKHGADALVAGLDRRRVRLEATLIVRDGMRMLEVAGRPTVLGDGAQDAARDVGTATLQGEIVDGKCHLGVMRPGEGPSHRACAVRCISGGAPPLFVTRDGERTSRYLLVDAQGAPLGARVLPFVGVPLRVTGRVSSRGDLQLLAADPSNWERLP